MRTWLLASLSVVVVLLMLLYSDDGTWTKLLAQMETWGGSGRKNGIAHAFAAACFMSVAIVVMLPTTFLEIAICVVYGAVTSFVIIFVGKAVGCMASFVIGHTLLRDCVERSSYIADNDIFRSVDRLTKTDPLRTCIVVRSAYVPIGVKNYGLVLLSVGKVPFAVSLVVVEGFNTALVVLLVHVARSTGNGTTPRMEWVVASSAGIVLFALLTTKRAVSEEVTENGDCDVHICHEEYCHKNSSPIATARFV